MKNMEDKKGDKTTLTGNSKKLHKNIRKDALIFRLIMAFIGGFLLKS
ncbi:hypothetical protein LCGC14_0950930 [marine sediment metagenome]|uniref:Uncharacterized protein n=1 Tax=marine sediment metagenome TaxID=412755 RepID=A0A0F9NLZ0_9ZZZZ